VQSRQIKTIYKTVNQTIKFLLFTTNNEIYCRRKINKRYILWTHNMCMATFKGGSLKRIPTFHISWHKYTADLNYLIYIHFINTLFGNLSLSDRASWIDYTLITNLMHGLLFIRKILLSSTCLHIHSVFEI